MSRQPINESNHSHDGTSPEAESVAKELSSTKRPGARRPPATDLHHLLPLAACDVRPNPKSVTKDAPISLSTLA